jgi:hypothetical protein
MEISKQTLHADRLAGSPLHTPSLYEAFPTGVTGAGATVDHSLVLIEARRGEPGIGPDHLIQPMRDDFGRRGKQ